MVFVSPNMTNFLVETGFDIEQNLQIYTTELTKQYENIFVRNCPAIKLKLPTFKTSGRQCSSF